MSEKNNIKKDAKKHAAIIADYKKRSQTNPAPNYESLEWKAAAIEKRNAKREAEAAANPAKPIKYCASMNGNLICFSQYDPNKPRPEQQKRGKVTLFSQKARASLLKYTRGIPKDRYKVFTTLTYKDAPVDAKDDLDRMLKEFEKSAKESKNKKLFSALWCMEYQERGVVHFHIWHTHYIDKKELRKKWNRITKQDAANPSTDVRAWQANSHSGLSSYVSKYAAKQEQKELPEELKETGAGRWWGVRGDNSTPLQQKKRLSQADYEKLRDEIALERRYKKINIDYVNLFVVPDKDIDYIFQLLHKLQAIEATEDIPEAEKEAET